VLNFRKAAESGMVTAGACTNCARCIPICPEDSLDFAWRWNARPSQGAPQPRTQP
jgi:ferredoxin-type protein NapH